jgi:hypothetical protein
VETLLSLRGEAEVSGRQLLLNQLTESRLVHGRNASAQVCNDCFVLVECDDFMTRSRDAGRSDDAEMPKTGDTDLHSSPSTAE